MPEANALMNLRKVLNRLKPLSAYLVTSRETLAFNRNASHWLDVAEFERATAVTNNIPRLQQAMSLYQGDFLDGFDLPDTPLFDEWVLAQRARLRETALSVLHTLVTHFARQPVYETAITYVRQLLTIEPWHEEAHRELMRLLASSGQRSVALAQYETCRRLLQEELAVEPSTETRALYMQLVNGESLTPHPTVSPPPFPLTPQHNIPQSLTSFIGRDKEIAHLQKQVLTPANRLITLTGPGGTGKTRLSLEAAGTLLDAFADGIWLVELAPLADPAFVVNAVATIFELREEGGRPLTTVLADYLQAKQLLLILDNCEHLIESCARLAESWLETCPKLTILTSSREGLGVPGEVVVRVPPLAVPDTSQVLSLERLQEVEAVQLFAERARTAMPEFALTAQNSTAVTQVCQHLDGIPLALELAAARVKVLKVEQIAQRLDDRFRLLTGGSRTTLPRQQTLRATIDWSYDLLTEQEQHLLQRLSVFAGGWKLEAAEAVCADTSSSGRLSVPKGCSVTEPGGTVGPVLSKVEARPATAAGIISEYEILDLLTQLVNKSLVLAERAPGRETRYRLLETIRQYAQEKLQQTGNNESFRHRHLAYFLQLAETAEPELHRADQILWLDRLEAENDNLRTALAWSLENPNADLEPGLRLATALVEFWVLHSHFREGSRWLDVALEKRNSAAPPIGARLLLKAGWLWTKLSVWVREPTVLLQESLALYRQLDDRRGAAWCLYCLALHARMEGDVVVATSLLSESLTLAGQFDDKLLLTGLYFEQAFLAMLEGDYVQATELATKGLTLVQETGDRQMKFYLLALRNGSAQRQRDYAGAMAFLHEAQALARELKNRLSEGGILIELGEVARHQRAYEQALVFYHQSLALYREVGSIEGIVVVLINLGLVTLGQGDRPRATSLFRESLVLSQESKVKRLNWWNIGGLARVALAEGQTRRAVQLFATDGLLAELKREDPVDFDDFERDVALARTQLGEEAFAAAWAAGRAMSLEEAVAYALKETEL